MRRHHQSSRQRLKLKSTAANRNRDQGRRRAVARPRRHSQSVSEPRSRDSLPIRLPAAALPAPVLRLRPWDRDLGRGLGIADEIWRSVSAVKSMSLSYRWYTNVLVRVSVAARRKAGGVRSLTVHVHVQSSNPSEYQDHERCTVDTHAFSLRGWCILRCSWSSHT